jgi:hypothetical protein
MRNLITTQPALNKAVAKGLSTNKRQRNDKEPNCNVKITLSRGSCCAEILKLFTNLTAFQ